MAKKLRICETVLRDGHQSILATRMRSSQIEIQFEKHSITNVTSWSKLIGLQTLF